MTPLFKTNSNTVVLVFVISILAYVYSSYYKINAIQDLFESRDKNRIFSIQINKEFQNKAGIIISRNNFDPILPNTLLKILLRTKKDYIKNYSYANTRLVIKATKAENIIDVRDIIDYLIVNKIKDDYIIYLK